MKISHKDIEGHKRLQFKNSPEASKAYEKVKKILKKVSDDEVGVIVLTGVVLIVPRSLKFHPANAIEI